MLIQQVQVGKFYLAKVSGNLVTVQVLAKCESRKGRVQQYEVVNTKTNRRLFMTAAKLRREIFNPS